MAAVGPQRTKRTNRRLARIRLQSPGALPNIEADNRYTPREARRVKRVDRRIRSAAKAKQQAAKKKPASKYDPLAPLTAARLKEETSAATRLQFGEQDQALKQAQANQAQTAVNTAGYYDDYRQKLAEATARIQANDQAQIDAQQARTDQAYNEDKSAVQARDAQASEQAAKLGRGPVQSKEGAQAVEAARSQGNLAAGHLREQESANNRFMELRGTNATLGKAQAMSREDARARGLQDKAAALAKDKGAFKVNFRRESRQDEREYAAVRKEFGLEKAKFSETKKQNRLDAKTKAQETNAQKVIARLYSSADKASARAQVRVAKLQLEKGKISKHQFKTIRSIYEGLPGGGSGGSKGGGAKKGSGSGSGGKLATWEQDKVTNAVHILAGQKAGAGDKQKWLKRMQDEGMPLRLARIAWGRYSKRFELDLAPLAPGANGQKRPN